MMILKAPQVPISPFDNALALDQVEVAYSTLLRRNTLNETKTIPRIVRYLSAHLRGHEQQGLIMFPVLVVTIRL